MPTSARGEIALWGLFLGVPILIPCAVSAGRYLNRRRTVLRWRQGFDTTGRAAPLIAFFTKLIAIVVFFRLPTAFLLWIMSLHILWEHPNTVAYMSWTGGPGW